MRDIKIFDAADVSYSDAWLVNSQWIDPRDVVAIGAGNVPGAPLLIWAGDLTVVCYWDYESGEMGYVVTEEFAGWFVAKREAPSAFATRPVASRELATVSIACRVLACDGKVRAQWWVSQIHTSNAAVDKHVPCQITLPSLRLLAKEIERHVSTMPVSIKAIGYIEPEPPTPVAPPTVDGNPVFG